MAGHSKWANIRHKKAAVDAKRGKIFTKISKEITVCARLGGGDPSNNIRLRHLIEKARGLNMPLDNITRAVKKGTGELPGATYEAITYEGYGPHGIAIMIETLTDNRNRAVAELRHFFSTKSCNLAETGAVGWMFDRMGAVRTTVSSEAPITEDTLLEQLIEHDITDITRDENMFTIICDPKSLEAVKKALKDMGLPIDSAELEWIANNNVTLTEDQAQEAYEFLEELDDQDDVQHVFTNIA